MFSTREAFFRNWNTDEVSGIEERLKTIKRRFPGPAGLLPVLTREETHLLNNTEHPLSQSISKIISSELSRIRNGGGAGASSSTPLDDDQDIALRFLSNRDREILKISKAPWRQLVKEMQLDPEDCGGLLHLMNIRWLRKKVGRQPMSMKIPFLALVVQEEPEILGNKQNGREVKRKNPSIRLMDATGTIVAAMEASFVDVYGVELAPGTAIAVKNAGFLRFKRQLILTVTKKNIICMSSLIRSADETESTEKRVKVSTNPLSASTRNENIPTITETKEGLRFMKFSDFSSTQAIQEYNRITSDIVNLVEGRRAAAEEDGDWDESSPPAPRSLFLTSNRRPTSATGYNIQAASRNKPEATTRPSPQPLRTNNSQSPAAPPPPPEDDFSSMFGDEDDDELMQALDAVDFLMESGKSSNNNFE